MILLAVRISVTHPDRFLNSSLHCVLSVWIIPTANFASVGEIWFLRNGPLAKKRFIEYFASGKLTIVRGKYLNLASHQILLSKEYYKRNLSWNLWQYFENKTCYVRAPLDKLIDKSASLLNSVKLAFASKFPYCITTVEIKTLNIFERLFLRCFRENWIHYIYWGQF